MPHPVGGIVIIGGNMEDNEDPKPISSELRKKWEDKVYEKIDKASEAVDKFESDDFSFKKGRAMGYSEGLCMAMAILSRYERLEKKIT